jgi:hypothetical protein
MSSTRRTAFFVAILLLAATVRGQSAAPALDAATAERFAKLALACIDREYPNKPEHVLDSAADVQSVRAFHPAFFGCFDWHSSVHGHWMLVRLLALDTHSEMTLAGEIRARLAPHFTKEAMAVEVAYLDRKSARSFERTYGWAWILRLALELDRAASRPGADPSFAAWRDAIRPLEAAVAARFADFLPKLTTPIRTGVHPNTAFALAEALDWARAGGAGRADFERLVLERSRAFFGQDRACPFAYEPSGEDFFSPCLEEADLMRRVLPAREFSAWLDRFWPGPSTSGVALAPAVVSDPTDPKLVHLDGLNLTRAWTLAGIARALSASDPRREKLLRASREHARAGLVRVSSGNYEGEHWLASFAIRLITRPEETLRQ